MEHVAAWRRLDLSMRVRPVPPAVPVPTMLGSDRTRRAVLERANGRRTPRDIAFVLGKGLFAVMSEIARMVEEGALDLDGSGAAPSGAALVPEPGGKDEDPAARLPRRRPGTSRINEVLAPVGGGPAPPRPLLALRSLPPQETGDPGPEGDEIMDPLGGRVAAGRERPPHRLRLLRFPRTSSGTAPLSHPMAESRGFHAGGI